MSVSVLHYTNMNERINIRKQIWENISNNKDNIKEKIITNTYENLNSIMDLDINNINIDTEHMEIIIHRNSNMPISNIKINACIYYTFKKIFNTDMISIGVILNSKDIIKIKL